MLGQILDTRYEVLRVLGAGGFGQTYIAQDTKRPGNPVCVVKQLKPASSDPGFLETARRMFNSEAETLEHLGEHPQIPRLLAYFEQEQEFYLVQEYIEGQPLSGELSSGKKWTEGAVIEFLKEILNILAFVHQNNVIHRDVKPDNIIRRRDSKLFLVDFGAVKQVRTQTTTGKGVMSATIAIGTPGYMSSEQGIGKPKPSSDIYALGIIAIQALTGLNPSPDYEDTETGFKYDQGTNEIIWQDRAQVSPGLASILTKMVKPHFPERYASASDVLQALEQLILGYTPTVSAEAQLFSPTVAAAPENSNSVIYGSTRTAAHASNESVTLPQAAIPTVSQPGHNSGLFKGLVLLAGGLTSLAVALMVIFILPKPSEQSNSDDKTTAVDKNDAVTIAQEKDDSHPVKESDGNRTTGDVNEHIPDGNGGIPVSNGNRVTGSSASTANTAGSGSGSTTGGGNNQGNAPGNNAGSNNSTSGNDNDSSEDDEDNQTPTDEGPSILAEAKSIAASGDYERAINIASGISEGSSAFSEARSRVSEWQGILITMSTHCVTVDSRAGWQRFVLPNSFTRVASVSGSWSVDARFYTAVGPEGHTGTDAEALAPYNQYKYDQNFPFGALIVDIPTNGYGYIWAQGNQELPHPISETTIRINDSDEALGDNAGTLEVCFGNS